MVGNGGLAGGVNFPDMWGPIKNCTHKGKVPLLARGRADLSRALGRRHGRRLDRHGSQRCALVRSSLVLLIASRAEAVRRGPGTSGNGTFAINGPETQIDFGYRAVHLTTVYSKTILKVRLLTRAFGKPALTAPRSTGVLWQGAEEELLARLLVGRQAGAQGGAEVSRGVRRCDCWDCSVRLPSCVALALAS